jgi:hypothetical protein
MPELHFCKQECGLQSFGSAWVQMDSTWPVLNRELPPRVRSADSPDDYVLVRTYSPGLMVNRYGFPPGEGSDSKRNTTTFTLCAPSGGAFLNFCLLYRGPPGYGVRTARRCRLYGALADDRGQTAALRAATQISAEDQGANGNEGDGEGFDRTVDISNRAKIISGSTRCAMQPPSWTFDFSITTGDYFFVPLWQRLCGICAVRVDWF